MKEFTVLMSLVDYVPVILFCIASIMLQRTLYDRMSKGAFALFATGTIDVIAAGTLKASYKLLYALGICDFTALSNVFFPLQSLGFLFAGIGVIAMITHKQGSTAAYSAAPVFFSGTFFFVGLMILGLGGMFAGLSVYAARVGKKKSIIFMVLAFIFMLCMGYLSSKDFDKALMNWIAQFVNICGQGCYLAAAISLKDTGAKKA